jgi:hypothetical protein
LRLTRQTTLKTRPALVRTGLTAALLLCVLSGALPAEAVFNPYGLMPCCRGMKGTGGEGHGNSCPLCRRARAKPPKQVQHDPVCGGNHVLPAKGKAALTPQAPSQSAHQHDPAQAEVEHDRGEGVSPRNTPQSTSGQASVDGASLTKPCPSDCCGTATGSFNGLRRPRHEAALTDGNRPRPPTAESYRYASSGLIKIASALRRGCPPRAPPTSPDHRTA